MPGLRLRSALVGVTRADTPRLGVMRTVVALLALTLFTACNSSSASASYVPWLGVVLMFVAEVPFRVVITDASRGRDRSTSQLLPSV